MHFVFLMFKILHNLGYLFDLVKINGQDEEDVKAIARLFADMGDSYVELIATGTIAICWIFLLCSTQ